MIRVLHIANNAEYSDNPISQAFRDNGFVVMEIDFYDLMFNKKVKATSLHRQILNIVESFRPNFVFYASSTRRSD
jgi:hypothetical protein